MSDQEGQVGQPNQSEAAKPPSFAHDQPQQQNPKIENQIFQVKKQKAQDNNDNFSKIDDQTGRNVALQHIQMEKVVKKRDQSIILEDIHDQHVKYDENYRSQLQTQFQRGLRNLSACNSNEEYKYYAEYKRQMTELQTTIDKQNRQAAKLNQLIQTKTYCFWPRGTDMAETLGIMNSKIASIQQLLQSQTGQFFDFKEKFKQELANITERCRQQLVKRDQLHLEQINNKVQYYSTKYNDMAAQKNQQIQNLVEKLSHSEYQGIQLQKEFNQLRIFSGKIILSFQEQRQNQIASFNHRQGVLIAKNQQLLKTLQQINKIQLIPNLEELRKHSDLVGDLSEQIEIFNNKVHFKDIIIEDFKRYLEESARAQEQRQTQIELFNIYKEELHESNILAIDQLTIQANSMLKDNIDHFRKVYEQLMKDLVTRHEEETNSHQNTIKSLQQQLKTTTEWSNSWIEALTEDIQEKQIELAEQQQEYKQRNNKLKNQFRQLQKQLINNRAQTYLTREEIKRYEQQIHLMEQNRNLFLDVFFYLQTHAQQTYHQIFDYVHSLPASQQCPELIDTIKIFYYKQHLMSQQLESLQQQLQNANDSIKTLQNMNEKNQGKSQKIQAERPNNNFIRSEIMPSNNGCQKQLLIQKDQYKILNKRYNEIVNQFDKIKKENIEYKLIQDKNAIKDGLLTPNCPLEKQVVQSNEKINSLKRISSINKTSQIEMENKIKSLQSKILQCDSGQQENQILHKRIDQLQRDNQILKQDYEYQKVQSFLLTEKKQLIQKQNQQFLKQIQNLNKKIAQSQNLNKRITQLKKSSIKYSSMIDVGQNYAQYPKNLLKKRTNSKIQDSSPMQLQPRKELFGWTSLLQKIPVGKHNLVIKIEQYSKQKIKSTKLLFHSNETSQNISMCFESEKIKSNSLAILMRNGKNYFAFLSKISQFKDLSQCLLICLNTGKVVSPRKQITLKGFKFQTFGICIGEKQYIIQNQAKMLVIKQSPSPYFQNFAKQDVFGKQNSKQQQIPLDETQIYRICFD